jgi:hypothetical protein
MSSNLGLVEALDDINFRGELRRIIVTLSSTKRVASLLQSLQY